MFKQYLNLLKTKKREDIVKSSIDQLGVLTKQINLMVNGLGEKVLSGDEKYANILLEQDNIWVKIACEIISGKITLSHTAKKREVIHKVIERLKWQYCPSSTMELLWGGDAFYKDDYTLRSIEHFKKALKRDLEKYGTQITFLDESIINDYVLHEVFGEMHIDKKVEEMLNNPEFITRVFERDYNKE